MALLTSFLSCSSASLVAAVAGMLASFAGGAWWSQRRLHRRHRSMTQGLSLAEQRFQMLAHNIRDVFWILDPSTGAFLYVSPSFESLWGRPVGSVLLSPAAWSDAIFEEDRVHAELAMRSLRQNGSFDAEFRVVRPDGSARWVRNRGFGVLDGQGQLYRIAGVAEDATERIEAEHRVRAQLARINMLNHIARAVVVRVDLESLMRVMVLQLEQDLPADFAWIASWEPDAPELVVAAVGLKSWSMADELGVPVGATILARNSGLEPCLQRQLVALGDTMLSDAALLRGLGMVGIRSVLAIPLTAGEQVVGIVVVGRRRLDAFSADEAEFLHNLAEHVALATHHAHLYETLQRAYDDLRTTQHAITQQERLQALGQMASGIAHDINNALSPIVGYTDLLLTVEKGLSANALAYLQTIALAADDVVHIVSRLKDFYRQREDDLPLAAVQLNGLVQQVIDLTRARWRDMPQQHGLVIEVAVELLPDLPPIRGVEAELREAMTNLVFNAVDAMPAGGTIVVRTLRRGDQVAIEVSDSGVGMDEETRRRCLEPFFTTKGDLGTGMGLAMVFGVMQRHDGDIEIDSLKGQGTTMRLILPAAVLHKVGEALSAEVEVSEAVVQPLRILCIDDEPLLRNLLREMLERDGHDVETADGGRDAVASILRSVQEGHSFDVVITDLGMPYVDGTQVARLVKVASPATRVILLTGWGMRGGKEDKVPRHVDIVLNKPPKQRQVRAALRKIMESGM